LVLLETPSLRSHALYLFIKCVHFFLVPGVFRFWRVAAAQLFERFLNGELVVSAMATSSSLFWLKMRPKATPVANGGRSESRGVN
jgi:hypothetical protein